MAFMKPEQLMLAAAEAGMNKARLPLGSRLVLGFAAGAYISLGFMLAIRVSAGWPAEWSTAASFLAAAVFPIGLILCLVGGGELLTGNMMTTAMAYLQRQIRLRELAENWIVITAANFAGALFVAYVFGHLGGFMEHEPMHSRMMVLVNGKLEEPFITALISGVGCNWLVSLAVWMAYGAKDGGGKLAAIWFPTMAFVALGFQHVVANMFLIPAAIFGGQATWSQFISNAVPVYLGNAIGGSVLVALLYRTAYAKTNAAQQASKIPYNRGYASVVEPEQEEMYKHGRVTIGEYTQVK